MVAYFLLLKSNSACWSRTKRTSSSSHWKLTCSRHDIAENCCVGVKQQSLAPIFDYWKKKNFIIV